MAQKHSNTKYDILDAILNEAMAEGYEWGNTGNYMPGKSSVRISGGTTKADSRKINQLNQQIEAMEQDNWRRYEDTVLADGKIDGIYG